MTDKEAIKTLGSKLTNIDDYSKAVAIAGNRLIDCQWHEYKEGDYDLFFGGDYILDLCFEDGSHGSFAGMCRFNSEGRPVLAPVHETPSIKSTIRYWMKFPNYRENL
jgi:chitinase